MIPYQEQLDFLGSFVTEGRRKLIESVLDFRTRHFVAVVEDMDKVRNASAVIRTCDCLGIQEVHIINLQEDQYHISRGIARGAEQWVDIRVHEAPDSSGPQCLRSLKERGYRVYATSPDGEDMDPQTFDITRKSAFVFGGEKSGITPGCMAEADAVIRLPMYGFTESYNVSIAASILLSGLMQRLRKDGHPWKLSKEEREHLRLQWIKASLPKHEALLKRYAEDRGINI